MPLEIWYSYVGEHLYELAVIALQPPSWQTIPEDESSNNGRNKAIRSFSVGCEDSGTPLSRPKSEIGAEPGADRPFKSRKGFGFHVRQARASPSNTTVRELLSNSRYTEAVLDFLGKTRVGEVKGNVICK